MYFEAECRSMSSKVVDCVTNRQRVCVFLLLINRNIVPILLFLSFTVSDIRRLIGRKNTKFPYVTLI